MKVETFQVRGAGGWPEYKFRLTHDDTTREESPFSYVSRDAAHKAGEERANAIASAVEAVEPAAEAFQRVDILPESEMLPVVEQSPAPKAKKARKGKA